PQIKFHAHCRSITRKRSNIRMLRTTLSSAHLRSATADLLRNFLLRKPLLLSLARQSKPDIQELALLLKRCPDLRLLQLLSKIYIKGAFHNSPHLRFFPGAFRSTCAVIRARPIFLSASSTVAESFENPCSRMPLRLSSKKYRIR